jgi:ATPase subunit of ABC transporter with duplicated ATPase domains
MLTLKNVTIKTLKDRILIEDLNLTLIKGDHLAVIGEEGNGKSTLCQLIVDQTMIDESFIVSGQIKKDHVKLGYLPQFLSETALKQSMMVFLLSDEDGQLDYTREHEIKIWLSKLQVTLSDECWEKSLLCFSGGERIKLQMVRLMTQNPDLLILDEPTNDLDLATLRWLENFIQASDQAIMFVSHDETLLSKCANRILHLEQTQHKTVPIWNLESLSYSEYIHKRQLTLTRQTTLANKQKIEHDKQLERWRQIYQKVEYAQDTISRGDPAGGRLLKKKIKNLKAVRNRLDNEERIKKPDPEEAITLFFNPKPKVYVQKCLLHDSLNALRLGERILAKNLELFIYGQDRVGIIGDNGSGKTTYLNHLIVSAQAKGTKVGIMPQNYDLVLPGDHSPIEYLMIEGTKEEKTKIMTYLGSLKFTHDEMLQPISLCSQGQKAKILLTSLVMADHELLILDEPTRNLSPLTLPVIEDMLINYHGAILCVTHDRRFLRNVMLRVYEFNIQGLKAVELSSLT